MLAANLPTPTSSVCDTMGARAYRNRCFRGFPHPPSPCTWFRYWILSSAFGNLAWYTLATLVSIGVVYVLKHALGEYVASVGPGEEFLSRMATEENVNLAYALTLFQLGLNLAVSMSYRFRAVEAMAAISATSMPGFIGTATSLRTAMAHRAVDTVFWVKHHPDIQRVYNRFETLAKRHTSNGLQTARFEALRKQVNLVIQLYYNPLGIRLFVHSVFCVSTLMALKTCHNLQTDGLAALPVTLFVGLFFAGLLLFVRIADNPFFDDGSGPRLHAHDPRTHPRLSFGRQRASVDDRDSLWSTGSTNVFGSLESMDKPDSRPSPVRSR